MPFTMPNFPILNFEQTHPLMAGMKYGAGIGQDLLNAFRTNLLNQELQAKMPYVGPKEREALKHAQLMNTYQGLVNKYTPEDYETTFQTRRGNLQKQQLEQKIAQYNLELTKKIMERHPELYSATKGGELPQQQMFSPTPDITQTLSTPKLDLPSLGQRQTNSQNIFGSSPELQDSLARQLQMQSQIQNMQPQEQISPQMQPQIQQGMRQQPMQPGVQPMQAGMQPQQKAEEWTYPELAFVSKTLGKSAPKIMEVPGTGQLRAFGDIGEAPVAQGLTEWQKAYQTGMGKNAAEAYKENFDSYKSLQQQDLALDKLIDVVNTEPEFKNSVGPIGGTLAKWGAASPERQEIYGTVGSASGQIKLLIAPGLKGAFTGKDQTMIDNIKANPSDPKDVFIGKLKAQKLIGTVLQKRTELSMQYQDEGMSPLQALKKATKETPLEKYKPIVEKLIHPVSEKIKNIPKKEGYVVVRFQGQTRQVPKELANKIMNKYGGLEFVG